LRSNRSWFVASLLLIGLAPGWRAAAIDFADGNLEAAIRVAIGKPTGPIESTDLAALTSLSVYRHGITNLAGLESATTVTSLDLSGNSISDLSPLTGLTNLVQLSLDGNRIGDLSPIASLAGLTNLNVGDNLIGDVSVLSGLTNLISL
jgi:internalin A